MKNLLKRLRFFWNKVSASSLWNFLLLFCFALLIVYQKILYNFASYCLIFTYFFIYQIYLSSTITLNFLFWFDLCSFHMFCFVLFCYKSLFLIVFSPLDFWQSFNTHQNVLQLHFFFSDISYCSPLPFLYSRSLFTMLLFHTLIYFP